MPASNCSKLYRKKIFSPAKKTTQATNRDKSEESSETINERVWPKRNKRRFCSRQRKLRRKKFEPFNPFGLKHFDLRCKKIEWTSSRQQHSWKESRRRCFNRSCQSAGLGSNPATDRVLAQIKMSYWCNAVTKQKWFCGVWNTAKNF